MNPVKIRFLLLLLTPAIALLGSACLKIDKEGLYTRDGFTYDLGEVRNDTDSFYQFVEVVGTYYDSSGNIVASESGYTCTDLVNPHDSAPFSLMLLSAPPIARYELAVQGRPTVDVLATYLSVEQVNIREDEYSGLHVLGSVRNNGNVTYGFVEVCAAFYQNGVVVDTDFTYTQLDVLGPGQASSFDIWAWTLPEGTTDVRLWVDADQQGSWGRVIPISTGTIPIP